MPPAVGAGGRKYNAPVNGVTSPTQEGAGSAVREGVAVMMEGGR